MSRLLFALLLLIAAPARGDVVAWLDSLAIDPGAIGQLEAFAHEEGDWPEGTADRLAAQLRARIRADLQGAGERIARGEFVKVDYLEARDFDGLTHDTEREFAEGLIRTEQVAIFPGETIAPAEALAAFVDPEFRRQTTSRIEALEEEGDLSCLRTGGVTALLSPTWACNRLSYFADGAVAAEHSQVVSNPGGKDFQPIWFKESVKVFVATEDGLALYYVNYTRGAKLGSFKKKLGRGRVEDSQRERAQAFARHLAELRGE